MALIKCSNCEKEYTDSLKACPHCGFCKVTEPSELETVTQTKTCKECGTKVAVDVKSCSYCGNTFEEPENAEDSKEKKNSQPLEQQVLDSLPLVSIITSAISCALPFSGPISISELSLIESQLTMLIDNPNAMINLHQVPDEIKNVVMNKATMYKLLSAVQIRIATYYSDCGHIEESRKYLSQGRKSRETSEIKSFDSTPATPSPLNSDNSFSPDSFSTACPLEHDEKSSQPISENQSTPIPKKKSEGKALFITLIIFAFVLLGIFLAIRAERNSRVDFRIQYAELSDKLYFGTSGSYSTLRNSALCFAVVYATIENKTSSSISIPNNFVLRLSNGTEFEGDGWWLDTIDLVGGQKQSLEIEFHIPKSCMLDSAEVIFENEKCEVTNVYNSMG